MHPIALGTTEAGFGWDNFPTSPREEFMYWPANSGAGGNSRCEANVGGTGAVTDGGSSLSTGVDHSIVAVRNGTTVRCYEDGTEMGTGITVGSGTQTAGNIRLACHFFSSANNEFGNIRLSEFTIWNAALDAGERAALDKFISPLKVRPNSILHYIPLIRQARDLVGGVTVTAIDAPSVAVHPRVFKPSAQIIQFPPTAAIGGTTILPQMMQNH